MSDAENISPQIPPAEEAYKFFNASLNPDGSLTRRSELPTVAASPVIQPNDPSPALSRDVPLDAAANTFLRLFCPRNPPPGTKLPLIIYFHGGGFILCSATSAPYHNSCCHISARTPALVASVEYRRAPEHRLPAAYNDAMDAVTRALSGGGGDPWVDELADFSRVILMGHSAGGNIAYRTALNSTPEHDLRPTKIVGLILQQPFFGGAQRTGSELKYRNDPVLPLHGADLMWSLALPEGADRAHEYCDPTAGGGPREEEVGRLPVTFVRGCLRDPLVDKQKEFAQMLAARGGCMVEKFVEGGYHAVDILDAEHAEELYVDVRDFIASFNFNKPNNAET